MVYLSPPYHIVEGVSILADHSDPLQFYYLPFAPHLTTINDNGDEIPQIQLIKYRGNAGDGGFLNFDVNLGITEDQLDTIKSKLYSLFDLNDEPRLAPVPLVDGSVKLMILGKETGDGNNTGTGPEFVVDIAHSAKPALYGNNQASFSVKLDQAGVVTVEQALQGELTPIGIVYSLDYLALRPAYSVQVKAEWDRVQEHLNQKFGGKGLFFSTQIDKVVDELIESKAITLEVDSFIPPGEDASNLLGRLEQSINEVKDMVLESFFEPSLDPTPVKEKKEGTLDKLVSLGSRMHAAVMSGGVTEYIPSFSFSKKEYKRVDQKRIAVNMTERTTVKRSIFPQAHLQGLFKLLREEQHDLSRFVIPVDLDHDFFERRKINVISRADFDRDKIESINVKLDYDGDMQNVLLDKQNLKKPVSWTSVMSGGQMKTDVEISFDVNFKDISSSERPLKLSSEEETVNFENLEIRPHSLYDILPIPIIANNVPWDIYPDVDVYVRYKDPDNHIDIEEHFSLNKEKSEDKWNLFLIDPLIKDFEYKIIYRAEDHRNIEQGWKQNSEEEVVVKDPFPIKRQLNVVPAINWEEVSLVFVDVRYEDKANNIREDYNLEFSSNKKTSQTVIVRRFEDPEHRFLSYRTTIIYNDGIVKEFPTSITLDNRAIITGNMMGNRIVTIHPQKEDFSDYGIEKIEVFLKYEDEEGKFSFLDSFHFRSHEDRNRFFEFKYANSQQKEYDYMVEYTHENGLSRTTDWEKSNEDTLVISLD